MARNTFGPVSGARRRGPSRGEKWVSWCRQASVDFAARPTTPGAARPSRRSPRIALVILAMTVLTVTPLLSEAQVSATVSHKAWDPHPVAPVRLSRPAVMITPGANVPNPFVTKFAGRYLMFASQELVFIPITLMVSKSLTKWGQKLLDPFPNLPRWAQTNFTWSPDVREVDGHYLMWFSAARAGNSPAPTKCIGVATARSVFGPYVSHAREPLVCQLSHHGSIDPRTFRDSAGRLWLLWKSDDNAQWTPTTRTTLYTQRLSADGLHLVGRRFVLLRADEPWEKGIIEAPDMVFAGGRYWLFFSGNWFNEPHYGIGLAQCAGPAGPCGPRPEGHGSHRTPRVRVRGRRPSFTTGRDGGCSTRRQRSISRPTPTGRPPWLGWFSRPKAPGWCGPGPRRGANRSDHRQAARTPGPLLPRAVSWRLTVGPVRGQPNAGFSARGNAAGREPDQFRLTARVSVGEQCCHRVGQHFERLDLVSTQSDRPGVAEDDGADSAPTGPQRQHRDRTGAGKPKGIGADEPSPHCITGRVAGADVTDQRRQCVEVLDAQMLEVSAQRAHCRGCAARRPRSSRATPSPSRTPPAGRTVNAR